jgi:glucans biosynthesis protein C
MANRERLYFFDNLRAFVIVLVIVLHASITYMAYAPTWWYVLDPQNSYVFTWLVLLIDVPIMPILFFIAGYFALPSLQKRGVKRFLQEKFVHLGIPWIFGVVCLAPLVTYLIYVSRHIPIGYLQFWATDFWGKMYQQGVYWFLGVLLLLFGVLCVVYNENSRLRTGSPIVSLPSNKLFAAFAGLMIVSCLVMAISYKPDDWAHIYLFAFQPVRVPLYVGYFFLGIYAQRHGWFTADGYRPQIGPWTAGALMSGPGYLALRWTTADTAAAQLLMTIGTIGLLNIFCLFALMASAAFFQQQVNRPTRLWQSLAVNSYGIYYVHPLILYPLTYLMVGVSLELFFKALGVILVATVLSWAVSAIVLGKTPGLRQIFVGG